MTSSREQDEFQRCNYFMNAVAFNTVPSNYIANIVVIIADKYGFDENTAMHRFFFSEAYLMLADEQMGMFEFGEEGDF